jgi:predicted nucleotide-binding protein (sugar kinase/HSP70/actin superfamily)
MQFRNRRPLPKRPILRAPAPENTACQPLALAHGAWLSATSNINLPSLRRSYVERADQNEHIKKPAVRRVSGLLRTSLDFYLEAEVGIEPAYAALQAAA